MKFLCLLLVKKDFDSIELIDRNIAWLSDQEKNTHTALRDNSSIFITFGHGHFQRLGFQKNEYFQILDDCLVYDENKITELEV